MKILILSDLHLEYSAFEPLQDIDFDVAVLAGDVHGSCRRAVEWASERFADKPVIYVPGNHEFYGDRMDRVLAEGRKASASGRVHLLDGGEAVVGGVRFLGATLWSDFALALETPEGRRSDPVAHRKTATRLFIDFAMIRTAATATPGACPSGGTNEPSLGPAGVTRAAARAPARAQASDRLLTADDAAAIHHAQRAWLLERLRHPFDGATVVVTHHAPHRGSLASRFASDWVSGAFINELPDVYFEAPVLWIHGHTHESFDYQVGRCRVLCNPRGYVASRRDKGNPRFNRALIVEVASPA